MESKTGMADSYCELSSTEEKVSKLNEYQTMKYHITCVYADIVQAKPGNRGACGNRLLDNIHN